MYDASNVCQWKQFGVRSPGVVFVGREETHPGDKTNESRRVNGLLTSVFTVRVSNRAPGISASLGDLGTAG